ncbi:hypothetical protein DRJ19_02830 [Candidatus Woesearchaeota archaeon]|nr:MAG: hypothetical protein DRJ19_02830 [Candidatus Woesearchaeota archaeon]
MLGTEAKKIDWAKVKQVVEQTLGKWAKGVWIEKGSTFTEGEAKRHLKMGVHDYYSIGFGTRYYGWIGLDAEYNVLPYPSLYQTGDGQSQVNRSVEEIDFDEVIRKARWVLYFHYCDWEGERYISLGEIRKEADK